jgi:hypothetical protein
MTVLPLVTVEIPNSVLKDPWMKGFFGQMVLHLPPERTNLWHAQAAQAASLSEDLSGVPVRFAAGILTILGHVEPVSSSKALTRCLLRTIDCLANPAIDIETLLGVRLAASHFKYYPKIAEDTALAWAVYAAADDAVEMYNRSIQPPDSTPRPYRFGMTLPHACDVIAWRKSRRQFPRPSGYALNVYLELERERACAELGQNLIERLMEAARRNHTESELNQE